jgi:hypothetical protein
VKPGRSCLAKGPRQRPPPKAAVSREFLAEGDIWCCAVWCACLAEFALTNSAEEAKCEAKQCKTHTGKLRWVANTHSSFLPGLFRKDAPPDWPQHQLPLASALASPLASMRTPPQGPRICHLMRRLALPLLLFILTLAQRGTAETQRIAVRVVQDIADSCENAGSFLPRLMNRNPWLRPANAGESGVSFLVSIWQTVDHTVGRLEIRDVDGRRSERVLEGDSCAGVLDALALVAVVLVEQNGKSATAPSATAPSAAGNAGNSPSSAHSSQMGSQNPGNAGNSPTSAHSSQMGSQNPGNAGNRPSSAHSSEMGAPVSRSATRWGLGATTGSQSTTGPGFALIVGARGSVTLGRWGDLAPAVSLGFDWRFPTEVTRTAGKARFQAWTGRLVVSPVKWSLGGPFSLRPGLGLEMGRITAKGKDVPNAQLSHTLYAAPELSALLQARLTKNLSTIGDFTLSVPVTRDSYHLETPEQPAPLYKSPRLGGGVRLGIIGYLP